MGQPCEYEKKRWRIYSMISGTWEIMISKMRNANPPKKKYTHSDVSRKKMSYNYYVR